MGWNGELRASHTHEERKSRCNKVFYFVRARYRVTGASGEPGGIRSWGYIVTVVTSPLPYIAVLMFVPPHCADAYSLVGLFRMRGAGGVHIHLYRAFFPLFPSFFFFALRA